LNHVFKLVPDKFNIKHRIIITHASSIQSVIRIAHISIPGGIYSEILIY